MALLRQGATGLAITVLVSVGIWAQQSGRKVIYEVKPRKPSILMDKQIGGVVKMIAIVSPSGTVKGTQVMGGNPILITAAQAAVKQWKYSPAPTETRELVTFRFDSNDKH
jgi:outer membrane biosynthesis protein TonB